MAVWICVFVVYILHMLDRPIFRRMCACTHMWWKPARQSERMRYMVIISMNGWRLNQKHAPIFLKLCMWCMWLAILSYAHEHTHKPIDSQYECLSDLWTSRIQTHFSHSVGNWRRSIIIFCLHGIYDACSRQETTPYVAIATSAHHFDFLHTNQSTYRIFLWFYLIFMCWNVYKVCMIGNGQHIDLGIITHVLNSVWIRKK